LQIPRHGYLRCHKIPESNQGALFSEQEDTSQEMDQEQITTLFQISTPPSSRNTAKVQLKLDISPSLLSLVSCTINHHEVRPNIMVRMVWSNKYL
jgi:hypothetical protein